MTQWRERSPLANAARVRLCWTPYHTVWVEFVVGSRLASGGFPPGFLAFLLAQKPNVTRRNVKF